MDISPIQQLIGENRLDEAEKNLILAQSSYPDNFQLSILLGEIALKKQDFASAINHFNRAIEINPDCTQAKAYLKTIKDILNISNSFYFENTYLADDIYE